MDNKPCKTEGCNGIAMVGSYCLDCKAKLRAATIKAVSEGFAEGYNEGEGKRSFLHKDVTPEQIEKEIEQGHMTNEDFENQ